jgi:phage baseplate assembly protein W
LKADAAQWLTDPEYAALRHRLEEAVEAALMEARRRVRLNEERPQ